MLLPFQGDLLFGTIIPRAMPWARSFCPLPFPSAGDRWFRACGAYLIASVLYLFLRPVTVGSGRVEPIRYTLGND